MAHKIYENYVLSNLVEDQYNSHLDLQNFCTIDNSLVGSAGMKRKFNIYSATNATQKLKMGEGNTQSIDVSFKEREYEIAMAQNRFEYFDEQEMTDPMLVPTGTKHMAVDMFNTVNADVYGEFIKAPRVVVTPAIGFDAFVDGIASLNIESTDNDPKTLAPMTFAFVSPNDTAEIRKSFKDELKYVEAFVRDGYIGTIGGVNLHVKKDAKDGTIVISTRSAVTIFNKKGVEIEQQREQNIRKNTIYSRKYYVVALTNETKAVKIVKGKAELSGDTSVQPNKTYYAKVGNTYIAGVPTANPKTEKFFEIKPE